MLGQPALIAGHDRGDAQGIALLAQEGVAAIARAVGPDLPALGEVDDVFGLVAGPGDILLAGGQRRAERVDSRHKKAVLSHLVEGGFAHPGHDAHGYGYVGAVGDLDAERADFRSQRTHAEGHDIHGAATHAAVEQALQGPAHFRGFLPVVGRAGVLGLLGADERAAFHPRHILGIGVGQEGVGPDLGVQRPHGAGGHQLGGQARPLLVRTIAPVDPVGLGQGGDLGHPINQGAVLGRGRLEALDSGDGDVALSHGRRRSMRRGGIFWTQMHHRSADRKNRFRGDVVAPWRILSGQAGPGSGPTGGLHDRRIGQGSGTGRAIRHR